MYCHSTSWSTTAESEDNCAIMAVREIRDYMENGNITHSVNYPDCNMGACTTAGRVAILHKNVKGMIGQYTTVLGEADINVSDMTNKAKGDYAYALIDVDSQITDDVLKKLQAIDDVLRVRLENNRKDKHFAVWRFERTAIFFLV